MLPTKPPITTKTRSTSSCFINYIHRQFYIHHPFAIFLLSGLLGFVFTTTWQSYPDHSEVYPASVNNNNNKNNSNVKTTEKMGRNNDSEGALFYVDVQPFQIYIFCIVLFLSVILISKPIVRMKATTDKNERYSIYKLATLRIICLQLGFLFGTDAGLVLKYYLYLTENDDTHVPPSYMLLLKHFVYVALFCIWKQVIFLTIELLCVIWMYRRIASFDKHESDDNSSNSFEKDNYFDTIITI